MLRNNIKIAWRQMRKYRFHSILNIVGLGLGMACCLFIYAFSTYQLSFDQFHKDADRTFVVVQDLHLEETEHSTGGSYGMYEVLRQELPQIEKVALYMEQQDFTLKIDDRLVETEGKAGFTSSDYFEIMDFPWLEGNPEELDEPNTLALTQKMAKRFFGKEEAVGKTIWVESKFPMKVVGIIDDRQQNSDFRSEIYFSLASLPELQGMSKDDDFFTNWGYLNSTNNILLTLRDAGDKEKVEKSINKMLAKYWYEEASDYYTYQLLPLTAFHFDTDYGKGTQRSLLLILSFIAVGILFMAGVNYTNMVSAQLLYRSTEMGVRKVLGSSKKQLFAQFMVESLCTSFLALCFAVVVFVLSLNGANQYLFTEEPIRLLSLWKFLGIAVGLGLSLCLLTSLYPAFFLFKIDIQKALKNQVSGSWGNGRKSLIVFQNVIALVLITATIVIVSQVRYLKNTDMGFNRNSVLVLPLKDGLQSKEEITHFLRARSDVVSFAFCDNPPSSEKAWGGTFQFDNRPEWEEWAARYAIGDSSYLKTFGLQLLAGRNFRDDPKNPEFLVNEKMVRELGFEDPEEVIGKDLRSGGLNEEHKGKIVGVVKDFNTNALNEPVPPTIIGINGMRLRNLAIKYAGTPNRLLEEMEREWKSWYPDKLFEYEFYDTQIADLYQREALLEKLIWIAAGVAILISSFGFLGLLSIMIVKRTKEIGVRKVLGSSISGIVRLLSTDFMRWVGLAFIMAVPIAWYAMSKWLEHFVHRITLQWWMFALAGLLGMTITLIVVSFQSVKAAMANPVDALRDE